MKFLIILISFFVFLCSCENESNYQISHEIKEIFIGHDSLIVTNTYSSLSINPLSLTSLETFNPVSQELTRYDLKSEEIVLKTSFDSEGPQGLAPNFANFIFLDSISIMISADEIAILDSNHNIKKRIRQNLLLDVESYQNLSSNFFNRQFYSGGKLYLNYQNIKIDEIDLFGNQPLIGQLDIESGELEMLPIFFPRKWEKDDFFWDQNAYPGVCVQENYLIYNFSISPSVFVFDLRTQETIEYSFDDRFEMQKPIPISETLKFDKRMSYAKTGPNYLPLLFDKNRKIYYRIHLKGDENAGIGSFNMYVTIFNESFEILDVQEVKNPKLRFPFVSEFGLGFGKIFPNYEDRTDFTFYDFKIESIY